MIYKYIYFMYTTHMTNMIRRYFNGPDGPNGPSIEDVHRAYVNIFSRPIPLDRFERYLYSFTEDFTDEDFDNLGDTIMEELDRHILAEVCTFTAETLKPMFPWHCGNKEKYLLDLTVQMLDVQKRIAEYHGLK
jgi:hypothetical protein